MDVRSLTYFLAVCDEGSISAAARRCRISQPSISLAISKLEREMGGPLFSRSVSGAEPLAPALALAARARAIIDDLAHLKSGLRSLADARQALTMFVDPTVAISKLAGAFDNLRATHDLRLATKRSEATVAIGPAAGDRSERMLWRERYLLCLPLGHPLEVKEVVGVEDLTGLRLISRCACERSHALPGYLIRPVIVAEAADEERAVALVEAGIGAAILPEFDPTGRRVVLRTVDRISVARDVVASGRAEDVALIVGAMPKDP